MATSLACAAFFFDTEPIGEPRLPTLNACALCSKPLTRNSDIFMYKGDTPFCSEDCRQWRSLKLDLEGANGRIYMA
jgi:endogenous inhibitor of DNA gyrase (YacG/DUF329 family)